jgi:hypothetical protein
MGSKSIRRAFEGKGRARRAGLIERYESNPANYLPGAVLTRIYARAKSQTGVEEMARSWMREHRDWLNHQAENDPAMKRAMQRWAL